MVQKILELGCGNRKTPGAIGVDINPRSDADVIHDLDVFPYPFADNEFERIVCHDVLEHVGDFVHTVEEIWRIARPGAAIDVHGPFMSSVNYFSDPTHRRAFTSHSFDYFIPGSMAHEYGYSKATFRLLSVEYDRDQIPYRRGLHGWLLRWANRNKDIYEGRYAFIYPLYSIFFQLQAIKPA